VAINPTIEKIINCCQQKKYYCPNYFGQCLKSYVTNFWSHSIAILGDQKVLVAFGSQTW
jgi:hypothetical protein